VGKIKNGKASMYTILQDSVIISLYLCCWTWTYLSYGMLVVLMPICPLRPNVHSSLTMLLSSEDGAVYRCLHSLATVTVWLGCPSFGRFAWDLRVHTLTHIATSNYHMHGGKAT
jgi:hypothetical protein